MFPPIPILTSLLACSSTNLGFRLVKRESYMRKPPERDICASRASASTLAPKSLTCSRSAWLWNAWQSWCRCCWMTVIESIMSMRPAGLDENSAGLETVDVVGPICETGDFLARGRELPTINESDLLAIMDAGAYGMVLTSNYNSRLRPPEVLIDGKSVKLIRRRETMDDLLRAEIQMRRA